VGRPFLIHLLEISQRVDGAMDCAAKGRSILVASLESEGSLKCMLCGITY
jgi:hypothetical protein